MKRLLAEECQSEMRFALRTAFPQYVRNARVLCLTDTMVRVATQLRNQAPRAIGELRKSSKPPHEECFIEWNANAYLSALTATLPEPPAPRHPEARMGLYIKDEGQSIRVALVEHQDDPHKDKLFEWPIQFLISYTDQPFDDYTLIANGDPIEIVKGKHGLTSLHAAAALWGYGRETTGLHILEGFVAPLIPPHFQGLKDLSPAVFQQTLGELSGLTRYAVAVLGLLNGPAEHIPSVRPAGRVFISGESKPHKDRTICTIHVPKRVVDVPRYAMRQIHEAAQRRLHGVRGHYRYLSREPLSPGWERIDLPSGEVKWRKWIAEHQRGSEELGVITRPVATFVSAGR